MRTYGDIKVGRNAAGETGLCITAEPHVMIRLKSVFPRLNKSQYGTVTVLATPDICMDMEWFIMRYPLKLVGDAEQLVREGSKSYQKTLLDLEELMLPSAKHGEYLMALPPRPYQSQAVDVYLRGKVLLLADQMGLGKTVCAIASFTDRRTLPALVVCQTHLQKQWKDDFMAKFLPGARTHIIQGGKVYNLPAAEVYIITYHKLRKWGDVFQKPFLRSIVFDEVQELRHASSDKYSAAEAIRAKCPYALGLSGTPIYNYGDEIWNIMEILAPGRIGTYYEFIREWCISNGKQYLIKDPPAFGSWLREQFLMLRRTRTDVGLELPRAQKVIQTIPYDQKVLDKIQNHATELAHLILTGEFTQRGQAAREFDILLRQQTGIAKAPFVAEFVRMLINDGQPVLLFGWHRSVYDVWMKLLEEFKPVLFTGSETPEQKEKSKQEFISGRSKVMIMSLRSGSGVDGIQTACNTAVFGELDWSPGVHEQCEARLNRDGVNDGLAFFYMVADGGSDPPMAEVLGLKKSQVQGILATTKDDKPEEFKQIDFGRLKKMAEHYLNKHK